MSDAGVADPCCQPCWGWLGEHCDDTLREFPNQARTRREFEDSCDNEVPSLDVAAGQCSNGVHFISFGSSDTTDTRYFDASGNFIGLRRTKDFDPSCTGPLYFPEVIACPEPASERICHRQ